MEIKPARIVQLELKEEINRRLKERMKKGLIGSNVSYQSVEVEVRTEHKRKMDELKYGK